MRYTPPPGSTDPEAPYVTGVPGVRRGSPVPAEAVENPQREIVNVIAEAGLTPNNEDLTQLWQALQRLTGNLLLTCESEAASQVKAVSLPGFAPAPGSRISVQFAEVNRAASPQLSINGEEAKPVLFDGAPPEVGDLAKNHIYSLTYTGAAWQIMAGMARDRIGQTVWFEDTLSRPGYVPLNGTTVADFAATWPQMAAYLATAHGQERCFETLAEREAAHVAIWHTLASGATVGWEGFGGVCKYYYDPETDTLYMPDLRGMFRAMAGDGSRAPSMGAVMGDRTRSTWGSVAHVIGPPDMQNGTSSMYITPPAVPTLRFAYKNDGGSGYAIFNAVYDPSRVVPLGAANVPRSWGALACAYFGQPD